MVDDEEEEWEEEDWDEEDWEDEEEQKDLYFTCSEFFLC